MENIQQPLTEAPKPPAPESLPFTLGDADKPLETFGGAGLDAGVFILPKEVL